MSTVWLRAWSSTLSLAVVRMNRIYIIMVGCMITLSLVSLFSMSTAVSFGASWMLLVAKWGGIYDAWEETYNRTGGKCCVDSAFASVIMLIWSSLPNTSLMLKVRWTFFSISRPHPCNKLQSGEWEPSNLLFLGLEIVFSLRNMVNTASSLLLFFCCTTSDSQKLVWTNYRTHMFRCGLSTVTTSSTRLVFI